MDRFATQKSRRIPSMIHRTDHLREMGAPTPREGACTMSFCDFRRMMSLAAMAAAAMLGAGCEQSSGTKSGHPVQPVTKVEVVHPERHTVIRAVGEPGQL